MTLISAIYSVPFWFAHSTSTIFSFPTLPISAQSCLCTEIFLLLVRNPSITSPRTGVQHFPNLILVSLVLIAEMFFIIAGFFTWWIFSCCLIFVFAFSVTTNVSQFALGVCCGEGITCTVSAFSILYDSGTILPFTFIFEHLFPR